MRAESGVFGDGGGRPMVRRGPKPRLLVVDDDPVVHAAVESAFRAGFDVELTRGLEEARGMLGGHEEFDAVLSGVDLCDGSGLELVPEVCGAGGTTELVFLSADPRLEDAVYAVKAGAFEFLRKPFHVPDLLGVLEAAIERRRRRRLAAAGASTPSGVDCKTEVSVAWQPIVRAHDHSIFAYEALARFPNIKSSRLPEAFAEWARTGEVVEVGRRVRRAIGRQMDRVPEGVSVFLNLHPSELLDPELLDPEALFGAPAKRFVLEITEQDSLMEVDGWEDAADALRARGYRVALDDFGAGHSGLLAMTAAPLDFIKIDRALLHGATENPRARDALQAIARVCRTLDCEILGEGVENQQQEALALEIGCSYLQGYLYGHPGVLPAQKAGRVAYLPSA
ncbi:MAG: hypothetical protein RL562_3604 [Planctomycetota bacterium]|jgi:EAL domain-containing protein (putative c-di-GMP-specific phosphodiesterase class I)